MFYNTVSQCLLRQLTLSVTNMLHSEHVPYKQRPINMKKMFSLKILNDTDTILCVLNMKILHAQTHDV